MEKYRKLIKCRLIGSVACVLASCALMLISRYLSRQVEIPPPEYVSGFQMGILCGVIVISASFIMRYAAALRNNEKLKLLHISEFDERKQLILQKSGSIGMNIACLGLAIGTVASGYFSQTAFLALLGATVFVTLVRGALKLFYFKKY